ncbi:MAG TPA: PEP-CTERM sorting domain-containing protein [Opitutaceae bacterium]|nr:PEP-CTERM sorting domain-containing protein [Opitutaceae bacterium]
MTCVYHSLSRPLPHRARRFVPAAAKALALTLAVAGLACPLSAAVAAPYTASLNITDDSGNAWSVDLGSVLSYNSSTGAVSMDYGSTPSSNWSWTNSQGAPIMVGVTDSTGKVTQEQGVQWHSSDMNPDGSWKSLVTFFATGNTDPVLSYGFTARNATASTQNYSFTYGEAASPSVTGSYSLYADIAGSITNAVNGTPAMIAPVSPNTKIQNLSLSTDGGATLFDGGVDVGPAGSTFPTIGTNTGTVTYGVFSSTLTGMTSTPLDFWQFQTSFSLTGGKDVASLSGFADLEQNVETSIPEPATCAALIGALALGAAALRRRKTAGLLKL